MSGDLSDEPLPGQMEHWQAMHLYYRENDNRADTLTYKQQL